MCGISLRYRNLYLLYDPWYSGNLRQHWAVSLDDIHENPTCDKSAITISEVWWQGPSVDITPRNPFVLEVPYEYLKLNPSIVTMGPMIQWPFNRNCPLIEGYWPTTNQPTVQPTDWPNDWLAVWLGWEAEVSSPTPTLVLRLTNKNKFFFYFHTNTIELMVEGLLSALFSVLTFEMTEIFF